MALSDAGLHDALPIYPDICLIDINLPTVSGFELARRLLAQDAGARIIMFSMKIGRAHV